jgi:transcriptional regulator with GAF, ATPase, and Fis domain
MKGSDPVVQLLQTVTSTRQISLCRRRASLVVVAGRDAGKRIDFDGRARIGTRALADLALTDTKVSGLHCEISCGDDLRVRDLASKNGTFLGGFRVLEAVVPPGETIAVGDSRVRVLPADELVDVPLHRDDDFFGIIGQSAAIRALTARIERLCASDTTVLITGETGSGKERVAEALHLGSRRAAHPFEVVDCGSLPSTLIEAELFGWERGAFTGAVGRSAGAFERAHTGTLFLDEIGELPIDLQPKLLRVLESRTVRRLGGGRPIDVDVRVVSATNRDLAMEVNRGRFREDLFYRLAVVTLAVPPLRERPDDVPLLAMHLLREMGVDPATCLTVESLAALQRYDWPGNVRELRNMLERAAVLMEPLAPGERRAEPAPATVAPIPPPAAALTPAIDLTVPLRIAKQRAIEELERAYIAALLPACNGNISEMARRMGMDRMSIHRLLRRLERRGAGEPGE